MILGAVGLLVLGILAFWVLNQGRIWFVESEAGVKTAVIGGLVALFGYWFTQRQIKERDIAEAHRPKKIELYETFFEIINYVLDAARNDELSGLKDEIPDDLQELYTRLNQGLITFASPKVIKKWLGYRIASKKPSDYKNLILKLDDLLQEIRKDLRNGNRGLDRGDLMKLFLKDPTELDGDNINKDYK